MLLSEKRAVVYGAGGAIGGAVARAFAREGATVHLAGRKADSLETTRQDIIANGGFAEASQVDAFDERAIEAHLAGVADQAGGIDILINAVGFDSRQGQTLTDVPLADFAFPIERWTTTQFLTARTAARRMIVRGSGVILTLSATPGGRAVPLSAGFGVACAAIEGLSRTLAAELGPHGIRVVCLRSQRIGETLRPRREFPDLAREDFRAFLEDMTLLGRLPSLADIAQAAVFAASDRAAAMTGAVVNLTCGAAID
jgi:NAD(P)-dependent dehydrogenase (short-subunit alcohol dehydrogenase family)